MLLRHLSHLGRQFWFGVAGVMVFSVCNTVGAQQTPTARQLENWLKTFPDADQNGDGKLTVDEANAYRKRLRTDRKGRSQNPGAPREFRVDPGWDNDRFPEHAVCYLDPEKIKSIYAGTLKNTRQPAVVSYEKPNDGALRVVATGHSFMAPGFRTMPLIVQAAGMKQPFYAHTGGGMTGSTRYKWEQENGIFQFEGKPVPKLLASISNAKWDAMMWGPYFNDRPQYYSCWIDFCLKYNPSMKFYLSDAWPQLYQLGENPKSESFFTEQVLDRMGRERSGGYVTLVETLRKECNAEVFILPTSDAMVLAGKAFLKGELPGVEGIHKVIGGKERSLWRDQLGHIGPGFDRLEGYVFYSTLYGKSPEKISTSIKFGGDSRFPSDALDQVFRKIAWQAVINNPLSGVQDKDGDGIAD